MEKELYDRLAKPVYPDSLMTLDPQYRMDITLFTLEAIRSHQCECHPDRDGENLVLTDAIEIVKDYR